MDRNRGHPAKQIVEVAESFLSREVPRINLAKTIRYYLSVSAFLLVVIVNITVPDAKVLPPQPKEMLNLVSLFLFAGLAAYVTYGHVFRRQPAGRVATFADVGLIFAVWFLIWLVTIGKMGLAGHPSSFPSPNDAFDVFRTDFEWLVIYGSVDSLIRVAVGYVLALATGIPLGILGGRSLRAFNAGYPVAKISAHIPPIVFFPYTLALLPSIQHSIIFMVWIGAFWPILINTMFGIVTLDRRYIEYARLLGAGTRRMYTKVILPGAMSAILAGCLVGLVVAFVLLTAGELVGAKSGLGFYIMYHLDILYFDKVIAGMLLMAFWVFVMITVGFDVIQARLLRWKRKVI